MLVYLEEWHIGDGMPAPTVGGVSNLAVVAEQTAWRRADTTAAQPADRGVGPIDPGTLPDVVGTVVWRPEDHPDPGGELADLAGLGFVVRAIDGLVLARSERSEATDTSFDAQWARSTPPTPPVGSVVVLPAVRLTVDPGYLWGDLRDLDGAAPHGWIGYRVERIRPYRSACDGGRVVLADEPVAVSDPDDATLGFLLDVTAVAPLGDR